MVDTCDTCGRRNELFRLPDREDSNCVECNADISILVLFYRKWEIAERNGDDSADLEAEIVPILHRFLSVLVLWLAQVRSRFVHGLKLQEGTTT